jgi:hypothetical protein
MKKPMAATNCLLLLILMLLFNAPQATAQNYEYVPFADNATWYNTIEMKSCRTLGDTVIKNLHYLKVYEGVEPDNGNLCGFIRNDTANKRVFWIENAFYGSTDTTERLLYDFSLQVGDTIFLKSGYFNTEFRVVCVDEVSIYTGRNEPPHALTANINDSVVTLKDSSYRRQLLVNVMPMETNEYHYFMSSQIWTEGIGSSNGLFENISQHFFLYDGGYPRLLCYGQNDNILLSYPLFDLDTVPDDCHSFPFGVGITENKSQPDIKLYPNPATEYINLEISDFDLQNNGVVLVYNIQGVCLQTKPITSSITELSLNTYGRGIYLIEVRQKNRVKYYSKIIKN